VTLCLSPRVVPWIAPVALFVVFVLLFWPWVTTFPGPKDIYTQTGWDTAFGGEGRFGSEGSWSGVFYIVFLLVALVMAFAAVLVPHLSVELPREVQKLWPWRSAIVAGVTLAALLFLGWQLVVSRFGLERAVRQAAAVESKPEAGRGQEPTNLQIAQLTLQRTLYVRLAVFFHLLAVAGIALEFWLKQRAARSQPLPRLELHW
jgi:hypothetical protein